MLASLDLPNLEHRPMVIVHADDRGWTKGNSVPALQFVRSSQSERSDKRSPRGPGPWSATLGRRHPGTYGAGNGPVVNRHQRLAAPLGWGLWPGCVQRFWSDSVQHSDPTAFGVLTNLPPHLHAKRTTQIVFRCCLRFANGPTDRPTGLSVWDRGSTDSD